MATLAMIFVLSHDTKGAYVYKEVDEKGSELPYGEYKIGTLYVRKTALGNAKADAVITVTVESVADMPQPRRQAMAKKVAAPTRRRAA